MVSHTFPGIAPIVVSTKTFDARLDKYDSGEGFVAAQVATAPSVGGNNVVIRIRNPTGSGITVRITKLILAAATANRFQISNPVTPANADFTTPGAITITNRKQGGPVAKATASAQNNAALAVNGQGGAARLLAGDSKELLEGIILPANSSVDVGSMNTATTDIVDIGAEWYEE